MLISPKDQAAFTSSSQDTTPARAERDSVFLQATISLADGTASDVFRVRNISRTGMMGEGPISFAAESRLLVELRNIGKVPGTVIWTEGNRFGLRFDHPIDPKLARQQVVRQPQPQAQPRPIVAPFS